MKKTTVIMLTAALAGVTVFESCKKYEEGPSLSLRSRKERVANTWKVDKYFLNGVDQTTNYNTLFPNATLMFDKDGTAKATYTVFNSAVTTAGTWKLANNDEAIEVTMTANGSTSTSQSTILKLKEKELWVKDIGNDANSPNDDTETHFVPAE